jgi:hypothetical protein
MSPDDSEEFTERFRRDRREHGGMPGHLDDDQLARLTQEERVAAGLEPFDPDEVPPATDEPVPPPPVTATESYAQQRAEIRREEEKGEIVQRGDQRPYPPSRYE